MKTITHILLFTILTTSVYAQFDYEASKDYPFGRLNPNAPIQVKDFESMIGECKCASTTRKSDGTWNASENMLWRFKYIMNGMAVQDETLKEDGSHSGSIRQFIQDSSKWYVHWYSASTPSPKLSTWKGTTSNDKIVLYKDQKAPNGMDGFFRLTFYDMSKSGYKWIGEWTDKAEKTIYPTWKIDCVRKEN